MALALPWRCSLLLLLLFPSLSMQQDVAAYVNYLMCSRNTTSSLSTTFTGNLSAALRNFTSQSAQGSKYAISTATGLDGLYAAFQCRGDLSVQTCGECVQNITISLPEACPTSVGARIRVDGCFLRYDNQSFFELDTAIVVGLCNTAKTSDATTLSTIADVMEKVTSEAPKQGGYWASATTSGMYAAAQCLGYLSQSECSQCLVRYSYNSIGCGAALGERLLLASCDYRYEAYNFLESLPPPGAAAPAPSPLPANLTPAGSSPVPLSHPAGSKTAIIIALSVVAGVIIVGGVLCAMVLKCYEASKIKGVKLVNKTASWPRQFLQNKVQLFSLEELEEATGHFHHTNKLGEGGFGVVYLGTLSNGERVAIKKLTIGGQQGKQEFLNEVSLITSVQHKNLIRLLGCCVEGPERILVYEYLPNKSLDFLLSGEPRGNTILNWSTRFNIVFGMAKGLAYLHEESHTRIIHRDIKPSNILLDDQLNPVIADFGLARLVKDNASHVNTGVAGTIGYLAPEYALHGALSEKVDVFSFGLVALETVTGKQNVHGRLLTWVWEKYREEKILDLVDERLGGAFSPEQAIRVVHVALLCTQENPKQRPTMSQITLWLSGSSGILEIPSRPTFLDYNDSTAPASGFNQPYTSTSSTSSQSTNAFKGQVSWISGGVQSMSEVLDPR